MHSKLLSFMPTTSLLLYRGGGGLSGRCVHWEQLWIILLTHMTNKCMSSVDVSLCKGFHTCSPSFFLREKISSEMKTGWAFKGRAVNTYSQKIWSSSGIGFSSRLSFNMLKKELCLDMQYCIFLILHCRLYPQPRCKKEKDREWKEWGETGKGEERGR